MVLEIVKSRHDTTEKFRDICRLFVERKASIDYVLDMVKKLRLIKEKSNSKNDRKKR